MSEQIIGPEKVIVVPESDPLYKTWLWRQDSQTLFRLKPVLERLQHIPDQPCRLGINPYDCARENDNRLCVTCAIRDIRAALFGEQPEESNGTD